MKRRRVAILVMFVFVAAGFTCWLDPAARVEGWLRGEPFYRGRSATAWRRDLRHQDESRSAEAYRLLVEGKVEAVPVCAWLLRTAPEATVRWRAADAIGKAGKDAQSAGREIVAALSDPDPLVRGVAIRVVGDLAPNLPEAIPRLTALFPEIEAVRAVARYGPAGGPAVGELTELLKDNNATVRWQAVRALGKLGDSAIPALPKIVDRLTADPDPLVREHAAEAVGDIGPGAAEGIPALVKALQDPVAKVRRDAVRSLGQMGKAAEGVIAEVRKSELDPDPEVSGAATRAVRLIDPTATRKH